MIKNIFLKNLKNNNKGIIFLDFTQKTECIGLIMRCINKPIISLAN